MFHIQFESEKEKYTKMSTNEYMFDPVVLGMSVVYAYYMYIQFS